MLAATGFAGEFSSLAAHARTLPPKVAIALIRNSSAASDPDIGPELRNGGTDKAHADRLIAMVELRAMLENPAKEIDPKALLTAIKSSPLYGDRGVEKEGGNWMARALDRLKNLKPNWEMPQIRPRGGPISGPWIIYLLWGLLGCALVALGYFAFRHLDWKARLARRTKAILEEDEPERTLDEWLRVAEELTAAGKYREAVRALYLACLLQFDEHRVARFVRHETNWEHLARIEASERKPAELDFREPTKAFDQIWYGFRVNGVTDVERFRGWYSQIVGALR